MSIFDQPGEARPSSQAPTTFHQWLSSLAQVGRQDAIGDLARDYRQDLRDFHQEHPGARAPFTRGPGHLRERLDELVACRGAYVALDSAESEWATNATTN